MARKTAKKKAWDAFSKYIRLRDAIKTTGTTTHLRCITCNKKNKAFGRGCAQAGHFIPGRNNSILIDEKFVNGQCSGCNKWGQGRWVEYEEKMLEWYGKEAVDEVKKRSKQIKRVKAHEWKEIEEKYKRKYKELIKEYSK